MGRFIWILWTLLCSWTVCTPSAAASEDLLTQATPDLSGTWYLRIRTATNVRVPIIGSTYIRSTTHLLATTQSTPTGLEQTQQT